jgi:hypothetical protein
MTCIDVQALFGDEYRIQSQDQREFVVVCKHGLVRPHAEAELAAIVHTPWVAQVLAGLRCCRALEDGAFAFSVNDFPKVARFMLPRRTRAYAANRRLDLRRRSE